MSKEDKMIEAVETLINHSRFFRYDKHYDDHIKNLRKLKKHIENKAYDKYLKGDETLDDE